MQGTVDLARRRVRFAKINLGGVWVITSRNSPYAGEDGEAGSFKHLTSTPVTSRSSELEQPSNMLEEAGGQASGFSECLGIDDRGLG